MKEYGETAYQVGLLGPIGAAGRVVDRGAAREEVAAKTAEEKRLAQLEQLRQEQDEEARKLAQAKADEERKQTPGYALEVMQKFEDLQAKFGELKALKKPGKDATFEEHDANKQAQE